jgi:hypothetical protein
MAITFGSNENLIFVWFGASNTSRLSLIDDSTGQSVILWIYYLSDPVSY